MELSSLSVSFLTVTEHTCAQIDNFRLLTWRTGHYHITVSAFWYRPAAFHTYIPTMSSSQVFEQSIQIHASATVVERCITERDLMHRWLHPMLRCEPGGTTQEEATWDTSIGARGRFIIQIPLWQPTLETVVVEREPGKVVWGFSGFFRGQDLWECQPASVGTHLRNQFSFEIPNPLIRFGFNAFAQGLTRADMQAQLQRLKLVAESLQ